MLWQKESEAADALYKDYFGKFDDQLDKLDEIFGRSRPIAKSDEISKNLRDAGNREFAARNYQNVVKAYNYSLCFGENDSDSLSKAYANRAACFFELDQFTDSEVDNNLALNASDCSDELKHQIYQNKKDCNDFLNISKSSDGNVEIIDRPGENVKIVGPLDPDENVKVLPTLDFDADVDYPALANVLRIESSPQAQRFIAHRIVATCDIGVDQTILVDKSPVSKLLTNQYMHCSICLEQSNTLTPCKNCTNAMFCPSPECRSSILHEAECSLNPEFDGDGKLFFLLRTVLHAISLFDNIDQLMAFFVESEDCTQKPLPLPTTNKQSEYRNFTHLQPHSNYILMDKLDPLIYFAYRAVLQSSIGQKFTTMRRKRFLTHLIFLHMSIISLGYVYEYTSSQSKSQHLSVTFSYFNHSCTPNAMLYFVGHQYEVVKTMRPIKANEEICISYFGKESFTGTPDARKERLDALYNHFPFQCSCDLCKNRTATKNQCRRMVRDSRYQFISKSQLRFNLRKIPVDVSKMKSNAIEFMRRYGRSKWCNELSSVATCFMDMTWMESNNS